MNLKPIGALVAGLMLTTALTNVTHAATTTSLNDISKSYAKTEIEALVAKYPDVGQRYSEGSMRLVNQ